MTSATPPDEMLKTDALGRVWVKRSRREALLDEFERSGASAQAFAKLVGVNYQTFASWAQKRRKSRQPRPPAARVEALPSTPMGALRLVEAVVGPEGDQTAAASGGKSLCIHLPGGARVEVHDASQAMLAAELLKVLGALRPC